MTARLIRFQAYDASSEPLSGLTLAFDAAGSFYLVDGATPGTLPTVAAVTGAAGWYEFTATLATGERLAARLALGATSLNPYVEFDYAESDPDFRAAPSAADYTAARAAKLDNLDAAISTRLASAGYTAPPSAATVADAVWDEALSGHSTAGSAGKALDDLPTAPEIDTQLSGAHGSGAWGGAAGSGARTITVTVTGVVGARVVALLAGVSQAEAYTNGSGVATLYLADGTYTLRVTSSRYNTANQSLVVDGDESVTVTMQALDGESTSPVGLSRTIDCDARSLGVEISGIVAGDSITIRRTITNLPAAITKAWLTFKRAAEALGADASTRIVQLEITAASSSAGQITDTGADGTGTVVFTLTPAQSALLAETFAHDVQVLAGTSVLTPEVGTTTATLGVTTSTS